MFATTTKVNPNASVTCPACGDFVTLHSCSPQEIREAVEQSADIGEFEGFDYALGL